MNGGPSKRRPLLILTLIAAVVIALVVLLWKDKFGGDFHVLYAATYGTLRGVSPYDEVGQAALLTKDLGLDPPLSLLPFGYPPWFVASTIYLGTMPFGPAGRLWFCLNVLMVLITWFLLTDGWPKRKRMTALVASALFLPSLGLLRIGQFALPVMLGAALLVYGSKRRAPIALGFGFFFVTFKPHLGALTVLLVMVTLFWSKERRSWLSGIAAGAGASIAGFVVDPSWPKTYLASVVRLSQTSLNRECDTCSTLSWHLAQWTEIEPNVLSVALLIVGVAAMVLFRAQTFQRDRLVAFSLVLSLIGLPYLRNYDFAVMIAPMLIAWDQAQVAWSRIALGLAWVLPVLVLFMPRAVGTNLLWGSAGLVAAVLLANTRSPE